MKLYIVQNARGQYFRPHGQHSCQSQWQNDIGMAKFYTKFSQAKTQCTIWYGYYPDYGCPHVLEFDIDPAKAVTISVAEHARDSVEKKRIAEEKRQRKKQAYEALRRMENVKKLLPTLSDEQKRQLGIPV
jgi:hypothetical protein